MYEHTLLTSVCCSSTCFMAVVKIYCKATEKPLRTEFVSCPHAWGLKGIFLTKRKFLVPLAV